MSMVYHVVFLVPLGDASRLFQTVVDDVELIEHDSQTGMTHFFDGRESDAKLLFGVKTDMLVSIEIGLENTSEPEPDEEDPELPNQDQDDDPEVYHRDAPARSFAASEPVPVTVNGLPYEPGMTVPAGVSVIGFDGSAFAGGFNTSGL